MAETTIIVVGFPADVRARELTNLCRFTSSGYEHSHVVDGRGGATLFVKFETAEHAEVAIKAINGAQFDPEDTFNILKAEMAKRELEPRRNPPSTTLASSNNSNSMNWGFPMSPMMAEADPSVITTLAVLGTKAKGFDQRELEYWFRSMPGFVTLQVNNKLDGTFVKFANVMAAERAMWEANTAQLGVEWARRNLEGEAPKDAPWHKPHEGGGRPEAPRPRSSRNSEPPKRPRDIPVANAEPVTPGFHKSGELPDLPKPAKRQRNEMNTITVLGMKSKGYRLEEVEKWFSACPGFVTLQASKSTDGVFVKFSSQLLAEQALQDANAVNFGAEWARRNLEEDGPAPWQQGGYSMTGGLEGGSAEGEIDTIAVFKSKAKKMPKEGLQQWFQERPGFVTLQVNNKINATFAKFASYSYAEEALKDAIADGISAEWARRNLEVSV